MNRKVIGDFIAQLREENHLTQEQLADNINVSSNIIKKLEQGKYTFDTELMVALCNQFNIKWYELLNGHKGTKKEDIHDGELVLMKMGKQRRLKKNLLKLCVIPVFIILVLGLLWLNENKDLGYELSGETENFKYEHILFLRDNGLYYIMFGQCEIKNPDISKDNITRVTLKSDDRLIISSNTFLTGVSTERKGYDELFPKEVVKNVNNWYYEIEYKINDKTYTDIIKLNSEDLT